MLLALSLKVSKFITLLLNLFEQCLARFRCRSSLSLRHISVFRYTECVLNLPSIDFKSFKTIQCLDLLKRGKPAKEKSPVGLHQRGLKRIKLF